MFIFYVSFENTPPCNGAGGGGEGLGRPEYTLGGGYCEGGSGWLIDHLLRVLRDTARNGEKCPNLVISANDICSSVTVVAQAKWLCSVPQSWEQILTDDDQSEARKWKVDQSEVSTNYAEAGCEMFEPKRK